jgi:type II secretory pathway pseudopilin PulG
MNMSSSKGFSLVETIISLGILTTGVMGAAAVLTMGMQNLSSSPADVIVTQKAAEAVEAVFSARDARKLTWTQINNTSVSGGIFVVGPQQLKVAGNDGLVNTSDDGAVETITLPGKDQTLGTADDSTITLSGYTREILIQDVPGENGQLRTITVIMRYKNGPTVRTYTLMSYLSAYS